MLRRGYLEEMIQVLSDPRYGSNLAQVEATVKKHEAISADILARVRAVNAICVNLLICSYIYWYYIMRYCIYILYVVSSLLYIFIAAREI